VELAVGPSPGRAVLLNLKLAWRVPNRTAGDLVSAVLLFPSSCT